MRRVLSAFAVLGVFLAIVLGVSSSASAGPYPPGGTAALSVSSTTPCTDQAITIGGSGFTANETVNLIVDGGSGPSVRANAAGSFELSFTTPSTAGALDFIATGLTSRSTATVTVTVRDCAGVSGGGGGLATTGVKIAGLILFAAVLLGAGAFFATAGRRRRSTVHI